MKSQVSKNEYSANLNNDRLVGSYALSQAQHGLPVGLMLQPVGSTLATMFAICTNILRLRCSLNASTASALHLPERLQWPPSRPGRRFQ